MARTNKATQPAAVSAPAASVESVDVEPVTEPVVEAAPVIEPPAHVQGDAVPDGPLVYPIL